MKTKKIKKLVLNKTSIANLGDPIIDLDKVRGGEDTLIKCPFTDKSSQISKYFPACDSC
jgi:hypothetical protein